MSASAPLLKLSNVTKRYDSPDRSGSLTVLNDVSFELARGQSLAIVGPSGSGKSTLLHIIGTLDRPTRGMVALDGQDLNQLDELHLASVRNRQLGFVFQAHYLLPQCSVLENVLVPTLANRTEGTQAGSSKPQTPSTREATSRKPQERPQTAPDRASEPESAESRATRLLKRVGLAERLSHHPGQLSGGERQRVAVVRALINQPQLLLADEPTGSLDYASAQQLGELLVELNREEGVTLLVVTHARELAKRMGLVMELKDGRLSTMSEWKLSE